MKNQKGFTIVEFIVAAFLAIIAIGIVGVPTVYGLVLAFRASFILGLITLVLEPSPWVIGVYAFFGHPDIAQRLVAWMHLPTF